MNHHKVIIVVIYLCLMCIIAVKSQRYRQPGGGGSRYTGNHHGQGHGYHNPQSWGQRGNNNGYHPTGYQQGNNNGYQQGNNNGYQQWNNNGHSSQQLGSVSCDRPEFTDDAKLEIEKCQDEPFHAACWDSSSK